MVVLLFGCGNLKDTPDLPICFTGNYRKKFTLTFIGPITDSQLQFLIDNMEEESMEDQDYSITLMTLAYFEELGADPALLDMLRKALGSKDELVIRWERA